jgi:3-hydroxyacyl-CoA dehydrogenase
MTQQERPTRAALVGAGMIGRAWAIVFAEAGFVVSLWDPEPGATAAALAYIRQQLAELSRAGLLAEAPEAVLARVAAAPDLPAALREADHVQENGPENLEVRQALFAELDRLAPAGAAIASSTSGMRPSSFTEALPGRARCLVAHPANPPYLVPLVELCPAPWTSQDTMARTRALMLRAGRRPATLSREVDGFVLNRLQGALLAEAFRLVGDGVVEAEDLDTVVKDGLGLRWSFMGPLETVDLNAPGGIGDFCARYGGLYEALQQQMPPRAWDAALVGRIEVARRKALPLSGLEERQAWRDRRLMALASHKAGQPET